MTTCATTPKLPLLVRQDPPLYLVNPADAEKAAYVLMAFMERQGGFMWFIPSRLKPYEVVLCVAGLAWLQDAERGYIWAGKRPGTQDWLIRVKADGRAWLRRQISDGAGAVGGEGVV